MEHHYLITEEIAEIKSRDSENDCLQELIMKEISIFARNNRECFWELMNPKTTPWKISGTPKDFGHDLLPP
ncbi:MAG: hypothetical protein Ct9H300mP28_33230 [Pseudomonadota bacterium]|nr:MAG: hypothetical protein Ct9H300mP28_33230 [Pseudomonadota bacterium]